jgi:pyruvate formate lyase activating enzyme
MEAKYYNKLGEKKVQCRLCPHFCIISKGYKGICRVRENKDGILIAHNNQSLSAINLDPIEKKPLYHFHPGKEILSLGGFGCNFHCACCQNYEISQTDATSFPRTITMSAAEIIKSARSQPNNIGIAFTYNEPTVWFEQMTGIAIKSKEAGLKNVVVSNGFINTAPLTKLIQYIDAFNIDLKSFNPEKHKNFTGGELKYVLETLVQIVKEGRHLEVTFLAVPGINDSTEEFEEMVTWISVNLGKETPLHISRYFPRFKMTTDATSAKFIRQFTSIAAEKLNYVYNGNIAETDFQDTICPNCSQLVVGRDGYYISQKNFGHQGECNFCGYKVLKV